MGGGFSSQVGGRRVGGARSLPCGRRFAERGVVAKGGDDCFDERGREGPSVGRSAKLGMRSSFLFPRPKVRRGEEGGSSRRHSSLIGGSPDGLEATSNTAGSTAAPPLRSAGRPAGELAMRLLERIPEPIPAALPFGLARLRQPPRMFPLFPNRDRVAASHWQQPRSQSGRSLRRLWPTRHPVCAATRASPVTRAVMGATTMPQACAATRASPVTRAGAKTRTVQTQATRRPR